MMNDPGTPEKFKLVEIPQRDGTSQFGRATKALDPDYVAIDERTTMDLLKFVRDFAKRLRYFGIENEEAGASADLSWSGFLDENLNLEEIVSFMENPEQFQNETSSHFSRPHFALFLAFLRLFRHAQNNMNTITHRHLDYYFQHVLGMTKKAAIPDKVHVLIALAAKSSSFELPQGAELLAGEDSQGKALIYQTDEKIVVNRAQIAKISAIYTDSPKIGMREERERQENPVSESAFMKMLGIAYGEPLPGGVLPKFGAGDLPGDPLPETEELEFKHLLDFRNLIGFVKSNLSMEIRDFFKIMMYRENQTEKWQEINSIISRAGKKRDLNFKVISSSSTSFDANLKNAVTPELDNLEMIFSEIPETENIDDAYANLYRSDLPELQAIIREKLFLAIDEQDVQFSDKEIKAGNQVIKMLDSKTMPGTLKFIFADQLAGQQSHINIRIIKKGSEWRAELLNPDSGFRLEYKIRKDSNRLKIYDMLNFARLMHLKNRIDLEWDEINRILQDAARKVRGDFEYNLPIEGSMLFEKNLENALNPDLNTSPLQPDFSMLAGKTQSLISIENVDELHLALLRIENYFYMPVEKFLVVVPNESVALATHDWEKAYVLLAAAHREKIYAQRRAEMNQARIDIDQIAGLKNVIDLALGKVDQNAEDVHPLERLKEQSGVTFADFLNEIIQKSQDALDIVDREWERIISIAELHQRNRLSEPVAQYVEWKNVYAYEDATRAGEGNDKLNRWNTFGQPQVLQSEETPAPPSFGWAISSPILFLSQGKRTISVTFGFSDVGFNLQAIRHSFTDDLEANEFQMEKGSGPFCIEVSTENGWIKPDSSLWRLGSYGALIDEQSETSNGNGDSPNTGFPEDQALQVVLKFTEDIEAVQPIVENNGQTTEKWPQMRLTLRHIWKPAEIQDGTGQFITKYFAFKSLQLQRVHLHVGVDGLLPSHIQNDERILDATKPFEPFGVRPVAGSRFNFCHPELVIKKLAKLDTHFEWMGVPDDLQTHYNNYEAVTADTPFSIKMSIIDKQLNLPISEAAPLFEPETTGGRNTTAPEKPKKGTNSIQDLASAFGERHYAGNITTTFDADLKNWDRYLQWELNAPDFQHEAYPALAIAKATELSVAIANGAADEPEKFQVNPPYTPKIKQLTVNYTSSAEIVMENYSREAEMDRIFHIHPFGYRKFQLEKEFPPFAFLPQFNFEGELYIGIKNIRAPQNLSILFQMAEGSADPELESVPLQWSYLSDNNWITLDDGLILNDATNGLINSGIMTFDLRQVEANTLLDPALYWLRAGITKNSKSVCDVVALHAQAVIATFVDNDNAPDHFSRPLPAESINSLLRARPQISGISQPYTSFGGKIAEQDRTFYTRISERLRHKQRALSLWDYEHIILEHFPELYKVKCLPADPAKPGQVTIVVIPDIHDLLPSDPFEPKAPTSLIARIENYLTEYIPESATVKVKNPQYVQVKLRLGVRFQPGYNEGFYKQKLNDDINRFLSPWAYSADADIVIGERIYANVIIDYIEQRDYIDYVVHFKLFRGDDQENFLLIQESESAGYWIDTPEPDTVLVAAKQHEIDIISDAEFEEQNFNGINYMKIELDFVVG
ncbi:MAG: hypothetical protein DWQ05_15310 [Calditrichaeota bacterium]|nr:MAG: hypothetical protein DWQ05_15310 [Calditrichota bacterium]